VADHPLRPATDRRLGKPLPHQQANRTSAAPIARGPCGSPPFLRRAYAVLVRLSPGYPPLRDTFRCITHPFAARRQGCPRAAARLACVKHAASVQSEPGSNSSVRSLQSFSYQRWPHPHSLSSHPGHEDKTFGSPPPARSFPLPAVTSLTALCEHFICLGAPARLPRGNPTRTIPTTPVPTPIGCKFLKSGGRFPRRRGRLQPAQFGNHAAKRRDCTMLSVLRQHYRSPLFLRPGRKIKSPARFGAHHRASVARFAAAGPVYRR
jgi:hypothetical protein